MAKKGKNNDNVEIQQPLQYTVTSNPEYATRSWSTATLVCNRLDDAALAFATSLLRENGIVRFYVGTDCSPKNELCSVKKSRKKSKDKLAYHVAFSVFVSDKLQEFDKEAICKIVAAQGGEIQDKNRKRDTGRPGNIGYKVLVTAEIGQIDLRLDDPARLEQKDRFNDTALSIAEALSGLLLREADAYRPAVAV